jgi:hypothetical protein
MIAKPNAELPGTKRAISWNLRFNRCLNSAYSTLNLATGSGSGYRKHACRITLERLDKIASWNSARLD